MRITYYSSTVVTMTQKLELEKNKIKRACIEVQILPKWNKGEKIFVRKGSNQTTTLLYKWSMTQEEELFALLLCNFLQDECKINRVKERMKQ